MGTFFGHVLPGSGFILLGAWWTIQICRRFYQTYLKQQKLNNKGTAFESTPTFPIKTPCGIFDIEVYVLSTFCAIGLLVELVINTPSGNPIITPSNLHHATMYFCFGMAFLSAAIFPKVKMLSGGYNNTYILLTSAFAIEGLLFKYHNLDNGDLHLFMHILLQYAIWGCCLSTLFEMIYQECLWFPIARAFFTLLQGTWFWQIAFVFYSPGSNPWGLDDKEFEHEQESIMIQTCVYAWHMITIGTSMFVSGLVVGTSYRKSDPQSVDEENMCLAPIEDDNLGYKAIPDSVHDK